MFISKLEILIIIKALLSATAHMIIGSIYNFLHPLHGMFLLSSTSALTAACLEECVIQIFILERSGPLAVQYALGSFRFLLTFKLSV